MNTARANFTATTLQNGKVLIVGGEASTATGFAGVTELYDPVTNLHQLGVPDKTIQKILRHSNVAVTQNCYIKAAGSEVAAAMQQFERSLEYAPRGR